MGEKRAYCRELFISFDSYDVEVDAKLLKRNRVHLKSAGKPPNSEKTQKPNADAKVRAPEIKKSSSNPVPSSTELQSESTNG